MKSSKDSKSKSILLSIWASILGALSSQFVQDRLVALLRTKVVTYVVKTLFKAAGIKAWLLTFLAEEVVDQADEELIEPLFRKVNFQKNVLRGRVVYTKVEDADTIDEWLDSISRV